LCCVFEKSYYEEEKPPFKTNLILGPRTYYSQSKRKRKKRKIYELLSNNKDYENEDMMMYEQNASRIMNL